ncbi:ATP-binding protein [Roseovarius mucosus]|uniref:hybrid sensor histidine kinase/response regulator n=1 Tax=Roseovarius mucosus TaxID=215743 RepID=UPI0035D09C98
MLTSQPTGAGPDKVFNTTKRLSAQILLFLMLVASIALLVSAMAFQQRLDAIRSANTDNGGWVVAQLEVDHLGLMQTLDNAVLGTRPDITAPLTSDTLTKVKRDFDIFYSRVDIFTATLQRMAVSDDLLNRVERLKVARERLANRIDAIKGDDPKALEAFRTAVDATYPMVRDITVAGLQEITIETSRARVEEQRLFVRFFIQSLLLFCLMAIGAVLAVRLWRELERRTAETGRIAAMLSTAFNSTMNAVIVTDPQSRILYSNARAQRLLGYTAEDLQTMRAEDILIFDPTVPRDTVEGLAPREKAPFVAACRSAVGREIPVDFAMVEDHDISGHPIVILFIRDISVQVEAETNLRAALVQAEQAARAKSMFLATMSHEMRTPLHGLMASLSLINETDMYPENRALLKTARDCSARALVQVDDVLELTRLGESTETPVPFNPARIAADIVDELQPLAKKAQNRIELITHGDFDSHRLEGLPNAFSRTLYNLAGNAAKFTKNGVISIRLSLGGHAPDNLDLTVEVEDTGIGIAPEDQKRIFESFETVGRSEVNSAMGTGLGLPIAKLAIERQGGALGLFSTPGVGSRFFFTIPLRLSQAPQNQPAPALSTLKRAIHETPKRILVVDDNDINLTLMTEMVRRMGHSPDTATNGQEALDKAQAQAFDVILMDFSMPVMDGPTAAKMIRASGGPSAQAVIIGVTALIGAHTGDEQAVAMDNILTKPVGQEHLARAIRDTRRDVIPDVTPPDEGEGEGDGVDDDLLAESRDAATMLHDLGEMVGHDTALRLVRTTLSDAEAAFTAMIDTDLSLEDKALIIHKAVGSTGIIGLEELTETLSEAETLARAGTDPGTSELVPAAKALLQEARSDFAPLLQAQNSSDRPSETV